MMSDLKKICITLIAPFVPFAVFVKYLNSPMLQSHIVSDYVLNKTYKSCAW